MKDTITLYKKRSEAVWWVTRRLTDSVNGKGYVCVNTLADYFRIPNNATRLRVSLYPTRSPHSVQIERAQSNRFNDFEFNGMSQWLSDGAVAWLRKRVSLGGLAYAVVEHNGNRRWLRNRYTVATVRNYHANR